MGTFYNRLSYSFGNEDWQSEQKALKIKPSDRVLCVTASGDRPLNLLMSDVKEIVTIDANPMQNALFELKKTAMELLPYAEYISFMGADPHPDRLKTYAKLVPALSKNTLDVWKKHSSTVSNGVLYQGAVEKILRFLSRLLRPFRGKKIDKLFSFHDVEQQKQFVQKTWHTKAWQKLFEIALNPLVTRVLIKDPGLYAYVDPSIHIGTHLYNRLNNTLSRFLAKESVLISLIFTGKVDKAFFPPYLTEPGVNVIKKRLDRLKFETTDLLSYLTNAPDSSFDCFSVSDVASYLNIKDFERLTKEIYRTAKPGARFCIRQFLSNHRIPSELKPHFLREQELETQLEKEDRCAVYHFMVGKITK